ncbi:MAG: NAD-dependent epimerase/dehydratase family protein [Dehalococcoidales bacterium]|jgi:dihydroflavonol-4-reductase|nr:NAD-dependent epimerase/dehydratase family protein [Dehalococcoidales bacterium]
MLAVVTGASGHLGMNLVNALLAGNWQVRTVIHVNSKHLKNLDVEMVHGDTLNPMLLEKAFKGADVVFNLAAKVSVVGWNRPEVEALNIKGPENVIAACKKCNVGRLIHASSFHACTQSPHTQPLDEARSLVKDKNAIPYDYSKACGETLVRRARAEGMDAVVLSPTGIIGPNDYEPSHFGAILVALGRGSMPVIVDAGLDWVDARDVAQGMIKAAEIEKPSEKYMLSGEWVSLKDIAKQISQITGNRAPFFTSPMWLAKVGSPFSEIYSRASGGRALFTGISLKALESNRSVSHARAAAELGYNPRPLGETIKDTIEWFNNNGYLSYNHRRK